MSNQPGSRREDYTPRTASVEVRVAGARLQRLRLTEEQARQFNRLLTWLRTVAIPAESGPGFVTDEQVVDAMTAAIFHAFGEYFQAEPNNGEST